MNHNTNFDARLEQALATLQNRGATSADCSAAAEQVRGAVRYIDEANESAPAREVQILAAMMPPGGKSIGETFAALAALEREAEQRALTRKIAVGLEERLAVRSREAKKAEAARDESRKPLREHTERVHNLAKRFTEFTAPAKRIVDLFRDGTF